MKKILIILLAAVVLGLFITQVYAEDLEVLSWHWYVDNVKILWVNGEVKNISGYPIEYIRVVVSFYDKNGTFITATGDLGVEYNPIMPNQVSPFKVFLGWNPLMDTAKLEFKFSDHKKNNDGMKIPSRYKVKNIKKMD